jgi:hypothetical protein
VSVDSVSVDSAAVLDAEADVDDALDAAVAELVVSVFVPELQPASVALRIRAATPATGSSGAILFMAVKPLCKPPLHSRNSNTLAPSGVSGFGRVIARPAQGIQPDG